MDYPVIWKEGTFILPQHFQQQERFLLSQIHAYTKSQNPYFWGLQSYSLVTSEFENGVFRLESASGVFQDGTCFDFPVSHHSVSTLTLKEDDSDGIVYLTLVRDDRPKCNIDYDESEDSQARFKPLNIDIQDTASQNSERLSVAVGGYSIKLMVETRAKEIPNHFMKLPIAKIKEVTGNRITLCEDFIPTVLDISASSALIRFTREFSGILKARGDALSNRVSGSGRTTGVTEYAEFLLLQLINRIEPAIRQLTLGTYIHPCEYYSALISMAGELATYMKSKRRTSEFPAYDHDNLTQCFSEVMADIDSSFKVVMEQSAIQIELSKPKNGIRAARLNHKTLLDNGTMILAVAASIPEESLRVEFPAQVKIGPGEKIFSLIQSALPGIRINLLTHVPSELPYRSGYCYFALDKTAPMWLELEQSRGLAIHVSGNYPDLIMELWAINKK